MGMMMMTTNRKGQGKMAATMMKPVSYYGGAAGGLMRKGKGKGYAMARMMGRGSMAAGGLRKSKWLIAARSRYNMSAPAMRRMMGVRQPLKVRRNPLMTKSYNRGRLAGGLVSRMAGGGGAARLGRLGGGLKSKGKGKGKGRRLGGMVTMASMRGSGGKGKGKSLMRNGAGGMLALGNGQAPVAAPRSNEARAERSVFFTGADLGTPSSILLRHFERAGDVSKFSLYTSADGGSRGMGLCEYTKPYMADKAVELLSGMPLEGRSIQITYYQP
mmetsp:Transcript_85318/g.187326  ORF Transcript_85318/g.187326 Transcript_85318/m.187326 type:complete len:272 (+) Transcript_85318:62-877(+)